MAELQELAGLKYRLGSNSPFLQRPFFMHLVYPPPPPAPPPKKKKFSEQLSSISLGMTVVPRRDSKQWLCKILGVKNGHNDGTNQARSMIYEQEINRFVDNGQRIDMLWQNLLSPQSKR